MNSPAPILTPFRTGSGPALRKAVDAKAKPVGALGRIEELAIHIGCLRGTPRPVLGKAVLAVFAGDHGIVAEGVTAYPADVSGLIAQMVLDGSAGANIAANAAGADVVLIDAGLKTALPPQDGLISRRLGAGTRNSLQEPAISQPEFEKALAAGRSVAADLNGMGYGILALGEIGIGNSSAAALVAHAVTGKPLAGLVGAGAGVPPLGLEHKLSVLARAYARAPVTSGRDALRQFGGFEMVMLAGAMIEAARLGQIVLIDGFIVTAAACAAIGIEPALRDYLLFAHRSPEPGHAVLLEWLGAEPLLDLGMRLGEGTGAALAIALIRMAGGLLNEMADLPGAHPG
jgi:nicotinate-nucleotide--dimethylbenzimidazole phosphoribosyltransferase